MDKEIYVLSDLEESIEVKKLLLTYLKSNQVLYEICELCVKTYKRGNKILIAGNGGSAADAQHFAGELVGTFNFNRPPLDAIALTTDTSILTAIGNDYGFSEIFSRQIKAHGKSGDVFIAISTSGNSESILNAIATSKELGIIVIGLTGFSGGKMKELCEYCICVPSTLTPRIQECHITIEHAICNYVERSLFTKDSF
jgi:D-sedoheptulose 7-phosphate isomerase